MIAVLTGACLVALGVVVFTSHLVGHKTMGVLYVLAGVNGMGAIITEMWPWILYPPLYVATAALLLITVRREGAAPLEEAPPGPDPGVTPVNATAVTTRATRH